MPALKTEYHFTLPKGLVEDGKLHRDGTMRLATARDELEPLSDPKVKDPEDPYLTVIVLSRVITRLGDRTRLSSKDIEGLFAADLAYLQDVYAAVNYGTDQEIERALAGRRSPAPIRPAPPQAHETAAAQPVAAGAADGPAPVEPQRAAAAGRLGPLATVDAAFPADDDLTAGDLAAEDPADEAQDAPEDAEEMELPTPRRARIEEVGRSTGRPS